MCTPYNANYLTSDIFAENVLFLYILNVTLVVGFMLACSHDAADVDDIMPRLGLVIGILSNTMCSSLSVVQKFITTTMMEAQAPVKVNVQLSNVLLGMIFL